MNSLAKKNLIITMLVLLSVTLLFSSCMLPSNGEPSIPGNGEGNGSLEPDEIKFQDPKLEQAIRVKINKPSGKLYQDDVLGIIKLDVEKRGITSIEGIQYLKNLQDLDLDDNKIVDISPLSGLAKLKELDLENNQITDLSPLLGLINLEELDFEKNKVSDISPLSNLTKLKELEFEHNQVSDISALANLVMLRELDFSNNNVTDISPLVSNTGIGSGDEIDMRYNYLDLTAGSKNMQDITTLINRGVQVKYSPQRKP